jgi:predicted double-glycine peptidase
MVSAMIVLLSLSTCEKASDGKLVPVLKGRSDYYVTDISGIAPRKGLTLLNIKGFQQTTEYTCGPAAVVTLLGYYGMKGDEMVIAKEMGTSTTCGTTPEQMATWLDTHGFSASSHENGTLDTLRNNLDNKIPTLVEWSDWGGHWVLVVGYDTRNTTTVDDDVIIFGDPYDRHDDNMDGLTWFNASRFYYMWYDARLFGKLMTRVFIQAKPF